MIKNLMLLIKSLPKWKIVLYISLSILLTILIKNIFFGFIDYSISNSVTLTNLEIALRDIIGFYKYQSITDTARDFLMFFQLFLFVGFFYLFLRWEKRRQYMKHLNRIIDETLWIAKGDFSHQIEERHGNNLDILVKNINNIVLRLKESIEEELHIEHTKNELITNVSHDLRTPLTSIVGYLRLIEQDQYRDEVALRHYTGIAYDKSLRLEKLINELFEYTRMQDNNMSLKKEPINLAEMLGQLVIQNELHFKENKLVPREFIHIEKPFVLGDGERLARVFDNLILNAIHYGTEGEYVDVIVEGTTNKIVITITNYGNPIASYDLPHLFDRFYRVEKSRATQTGGAGLGLAIAKSIVEHHDGMIDAKSNFDNTSFIVTLEKLQYD